MPEHLHGEHTHIPHISEGNGAPSSAPGKKGDIYIDLTNKHVYISVGSTDSGDWENMNGG